MAQFSFTCSCGETTTVEAAGRDDALIELKSMFNEERIKKHYEERHSGEEPKSKYDYHGMIDYGTVTL